MKNHYQVLLPLIRRYWLTVLVLLALILSIANHLHTSTKIVTINEERIVKNFTQALAQSKLSYQHKQMLSKRFAQLLAQSIHDYADSHHAVIVRPSSVIGGAKDITKEIEALTAKNLKREGMRS